MSIVYSSVVVLFAAMIQFATVEAMTVNNLAPTTEKTGQGQFSNWTKPGQQGGLPQRALRKSLRIQSLRSAALFKRRARDSNSQPVARHHISSVAASHSLTLQTAL